MDAETLKALKGSILKWKRIVKRTDAGDHGAQNCPLCDMYFDFAKCGKCPVASVGYPLCKNSPYTDWVEHHQLVHNWTGWVGAYRHKGCVRCLILARREVAFLEGLLPKTEQS